MMKRTGKILPGRHGRYDTLLTVQGALNTSQDNVQRKMIYACELLRKSASPGTQPDQATEAWYGQVELNGLCGGWVTVHKSSPLWIETLWPIVVAWEPEQAKSVDQQLEALNKTLASKVAWTESREVWNGRAPTAIHLAGMLNLAWNAMAVLEPNEGYGEIPKAVRVDFTPSKIFQKAGPWAKNKEVNKKGKGKDSPGMVLAQWILDNATENESVVHVETAAHHMSVRVERTSPRDVTLVVLESEKAGVVFCGSDWNRLAEVLQDGIYLTARDAGEQRVDLKVWKK